MNSYLTESLAREHVQDLLNNAQSSRTAAELPPMDRHPSPKLRVAWWHRSTARIAGV